MTAEFAERTNEIFQKGDSISSFFENRMKITNDLTHTIRRGAFFDEYKLYCNNNSQRCQPRSTVFKRMEDLKIVEGKLHGYDIFKGIEIVIDGSTTEVVYKKEDFFGKDIIEQYDHIMKLDKIRAQLQEERKLNQLIINNWCERFAKKPHCFDNLKKESITCHTGKWSNEKPEVHAKYQEGAEEVELKEMSFDEIRKAMDL